MLKQNKIMSALNEDNSFKTVKPVQNIHRNEKRPVDDMPLKNKSRKLFSSKMKASTLFCVITNDKNEKLLT